MNRKRQWTHRFQEQRPYVVLACAVLKHGTERRLELPRELVGERGKLCDVVEYDLDVFR